MFSEMNRVRILLLVLGVSLPIFCCLGANLLIQTFSVDRDVLVSGTRDSWQVTFPGVDNVTYSLYEDGLLVKSVLVEGNSVKVLGNVIPEGKETTVTQAPQAWVTVDTISTGEVFMMCFGKGIVWNEITVEINGELFISSTRTCTPVHLSFD